MSELLYLAGPMAGLPEKNFPAFKAAAEALRHAGYSVLSPAEFGLPDGLDWTEYLRYDLRQMLTCKAVAVLPGWQLSRGAQLETSTAAALNIPIYPYQELVFAEDNDGPKRFYPESQDLPIWQHRLSDWHDRKWGSGDPTVRALKLVEEVGEVAECIVKNRQDHPKRDQLDLPGELADVFITLAVLADTVDVDLASAVRKKTSVLDGFQ